MEEFKILALGGDGIGPEVLDCALRVADVAASSGGIKLSVATDVLHGAAYDRYETFCRDETVANAKAADAVLVGAVGGSKWDAIRVPGGPEMQDGLMRLRKELDTYAGLRPARHWPTLEQATPYRTDIVNGADIMVVREMCGGVMFASPRGRENHDGKRYAFDTAAYGEEEVARIAHTGLALARTRGRRLVSADKANVMESYVLWREIFTEVARDYPDVTLTHMYADNCAYQIARNPCAFDVVAGCNFIGDFLSDLAATVSGSLGMLPSACLTGAPDTTMPRRGIYEPVHGSAPDIAGQGIANPIGMILSLAMMFRYSALRPDLADKIETAVDIAVSAGAGTPDIGGAGTSSSVTDSIIAGLRA